MGRSSPDFDSPSRSHGFVTVIVPARNAADTLALCLDSLAAQEWPASRYEVIVVDDGSVDGTARIARERGARVISLSPSGPAAARNRAVAEARGDLLLFTDADCAPGSDWIAQLVRAFDDPSVGGAKGVYRTDQTTWTARFVQAEYESRYRRMLEEESIDFIDTYAAAYRRDVFEKAGGFDESFTDASVEDQELSFRVARQGVKLVFCPGAVVAHRHAADPLAYFRKKLKIGRRKMRVLARYPDKAVRDSHTPASLKLELLSGAATLLALLAWPFGGPGWLAPLGMLAWGGAASPFCLRLAAWDPALALRAPFFLLARTVALAAGMALGAGPAAIRRSRRPRVGATCGQRPGEDRSGDEARRREERVHA